MDRQDEPIKTGMARLFQLASHKRQLVICSCALSVISVAASFTPFIAIYYIIEELVISGADPARMDAARMTRLGWMAAGGAISAVALNFLALMCSHFAAFTTLYRLKLEFAERIASMPLGFHSANATGKLRKVVDENIEKLEGFIAHQLPDLAGTVAMPVFSLIMLFIFDWRLGLASFVPILIAYGIQASAIGGGKSNVFIEKYQTALEDMNSSAVEYVRGVSVLKAFNQTVYSFRKFHKTIMDYQTFVGGYTMSFKNHYAAFIAIINHVFVFLIPAVIFMAGGAPDYPRFALAALFYLVFSFSLVTPFMKVMYVGQNGKVIADGISRMDKLMETKPLPETKHPKTASGYDVRFDGVSFTYNGDGESVALRGVSFTAEQGKITALVGPSGAGKSTLAHLIPRFYDAAEGSISIGGVDVRDMSSEYLMSIAGFVFQDVFLFKQSVMDNLLVGRPNASRDEVIAAAKAAQCDDFVRALPNGYDTIIGGEGARLSGGERQRLVIARAILKNAPILVLDEATAFADSENERNIQRALSSLMKGKTVVIIAHRLSTVRGADKIVVVDKGRVVEEGKHDELAARGGRYSRMWAQYNAASDWTISKGA